MKVTGTQLFSTKDTKDKKKLKWANVYTGSELL